MHNTAAIITSLQAGHWKLTRHIWLNGVKNNRGITEKTQQCFLRERQHFLFLDIKWAVALACSCSSVRCWALELLSCGWDNNNPLIMIMSLWALRNDFLYCVTVYYPDQQWKSKSPQRFHHWTFPQHYSHSVCMQGTSQGGFKWVYTVKDWGAATNSSVTKHTEKHHKCVRKTTFPR